jgi:hypothetical protein
MVRNTVPAVYDNGFSPDWCSDILHTLNTHKNYQDSELSTRLVRQDVKSKLEAEVYQLSIKNKQMPYLTVASSRIKEIFSFLYSKGVWPIYGLGCGHCVSNLTSFGPFPSASVLENADLVASNYRSILSELNLIRNRISTETREFIYTGTWRSITLWESNVDAEMPATKIFKETMELLRTMPSFQKVFNLSLSNSSFRGFTVRISQLKPNTIILPHFGLTNTRLRLQIPLSIPDGDLFIYSHDQMAKWSIGKPLVLDDSFIHGVYNNTAEDRVVLLVDMPHPEASLADITAY